VIRMKPNLSLLRLRGVDYQIIGFNEDGEWDLLTPTGEPTSVSPQPGERVRCDFCRTWARHAAPVADVKGPWRCHGGTGPCPEAEDDDGGEDAFDPY
jgi:hypothetical protein